MSSRVIRKLSFIPVVVLASASAVLAQNSPATQPLPGLDGFSIPSSRPTPQRVPDPEPTVRPSASAPTRSVAPVVVPTVRVTPAPRAASTPAARIVAAPARATPPRIVETPAPAATPLAAPQPSVLATAPPTPIATQAPPVEAPAQSVATPPADVPAPALAPDQAAAIPLWIWLMAACVLLAIMVGSVGWWWPRIVARRDEDRGEIENREIVIPVAEDMPAPPPPAAPRQPALAVPPAPWLTGDRATLDLELIPNRAGTDPAGLVVDYLIVVRNTGRATATGVRLDVRLLGAGPGQDATIAAVFATPIDAPITPPFDLAAGATAEFGGSGTHPRDSLQAMTIGGQRTVVPVLAVNVRYGWQVAGQSRGDGQTAHSYVIGIARGAEAKLQPFPLDGPDRMQASVSALDYTVTVVS